MIKPKNKELTHEKNESVSGPRSSPRHQITMSRADYESIASAINEADVPLEHRQTMALEIATALCATNASFDPLRFLDQVTLGLTTEEIAGYSHALYLRTNTGVGATRKLLDK